MKAKSIEELFGTLQQSIVAEWRKHLQTSKYSKHMALDEFYKEMPELVDSLIEAYNGHVGKKVEDFKNVLKAEDLDALKYLEELHELCQSGYDLIPEDAPEIKSALDVVKEKIDSVMYKVRELKEQVIQVERSLMDCLNESIFGEEWTTDINEAGSVQCEVRFEEYDRGGGRSRKAKYKAKDLYDAVRTLVDHCHLYLYTDNFDDPEEDLYVDKKASQGDRDDKAHQAIERILDANGDGCDYIYYFKVGREVLIDEGDPEENW